MIKDRQGRTVYKPLSSEFEVLELRPSFVQKYDVLQAEYIPDRTLTPFVLQPKLTIVDPHGLESGDRTCNMINVVWHVDGQYNGVKWENGKDYVVDSVTHELRILANMDPEYWGSLSFYGELWTVAGWRCISSAGNAASLASPTQTINCILPWNSRKSACHHSRTEVFSISLHSFTTVTALQQTAKVSTSGRSGTERRSEL